LHIDHCTKNCVYFYKCIRQQLKRPIFCNYLADHRQKNRHLDTCDVTSRSTSPNLSCFVIENWYSSSSASLTISVCNYLRKITKFTNMVFRSFKSHNPFCCQ
jgi:hypothetical protein